MKKEDMYDGMTEIREDLILDAKKAPGHRWGLRLGALAAVVAVAVLVQTVFHPFGDSVVTCAMAAEAVYPAVAPVPEEPKFDTQEEYAEFEEKLLAWSDSMEKLRETPFDVQTMAIFLQATAPALLSGEENCLYSPANVYMALSMLSEVTAGDTQQEILKLLGSVSAESQRSRANALWRNCYVADGTANTVLANSLWMNDKMHYRQETLDTLAASYYASSFYGTMGSPEYDRLLQDWTKEQTGGLLDISSPQMDKRTVMALVSTLYYSANWVSKFQKEENEPGIFHGTDGDRDCEMMCDQTHGLYWYGTQFSACKRELLGSGSFYILLPDEGKTPADLLKDPEVLGFLTDPGSVPSKNVFIHLKMPKFDLTSQLDLKDTLMELGVKKAFDYDASDYSPLTTDTAEVALTELSHGVRLKVDEEGCVGAAYTMALLGAGAAEPEGKVDFVVDRPFLLLLTSQTGIPLFVGVVNQQ